MNRLVDAAEDDGVRLQFQETEVDPDAYSDNLKMLEEPGSELDVLVGDYWSSPR